jgi:hypothetical protein
VGAQLFLGNTKLISLTNEIKNTFYSYNPSALKD